MNDRLVKSSINATFVVGGLLTVYFLTIGWQEGLSVAGGVLFSLANLYFLWKLIQEVITTEEKSKSNIAGVVFLKFIVLWGALIAAMAYGWASPVHFAIGFTVLLAVLALKGFGRWIVYYFNMTGKTTEED
ncbi:hypothetical protein KKB99_06805 [bacterium]|nr:hypothetical protein [bacterium]MBU1025700.1 hypothetical protein [bacterium]